MARKTRISRIRSSTPLCFVSLLSPLPHFLFSPSLYLSLFSPNPLLLDVVILACEG